MAFPTVNVATRTESADSTSHTIPVDSAPSAGDGLLCLVAIDGGSAVVPSWPAGFTEAKRNDSTTDVSIFWLWKTAAGSEGTSIAFTTDDLEKLCIITWRISASTMTAWSTTPPQFGTVATAGATAPDPPSVTASWGAADNLWIVGYGCGQLGPATASPTGFGTLRQVATSGGAAGTNVNLGGAEKNDAVATLNPGTFTRTGSATWFGETVVIRPAAAGPTTHHGAAVGTAASGITGVVGHHTQKAAAKGTAANAPVALGHLLTRHHGAAIGQAAASGTPVGKRVQRTTAKGVASSSGGAVGKRVQRTTAKGVAASSGTAIARRIQRATAQGTTASSGTAAGEVVTGVTHHGAAKGATATSGSGLWHRVCTYHAVAAGATASSGTATARLGERHHATAKGTVAATGAAVGTTVAALRGTGIGFIQNTTNVNTFNTTTHGSGPIAASATGNFVLAVVQGSGPSVISPTAATLANHSALPFALLTATVGTNPSVDTTPGNPNFLGFYGCLATGTTSDDVDITFSVPSGLMSGCAVSFIEVTGFDTLPASVADAFHQLEISTFAAATSTTITLNSFVHANNIYLFGMTVAAPAAEDMVPEASATEIHDIGYGSPSRSLLTSYKKNDTTPSASWTTTVSGVAGALEINSRGVVGAVTHHGAAVGRTAASGSARLKASFRARAGGFAAASGTVRARAVFRPRAVGPAAVTGRAAATVARPTHHAAAKGATASSGTGVWHRVCDYHAAAKGATASSGTATARIPVVGAIHHAAASAPAAATGTATLRQLVTHHADAVGTNVSHGTSTGRILQPFAQHPERITVGQSNSSIRLGRGSTVAVGRGGTVTTTHSGRVTVDRTGTVATTRSGTVRL